MKEIHWTLGGNGVTNFTKEDLVYYKLAIEEHGDDSLYIGEQMECGIDYGFALCCTHKEDLGDFWGVFKEIKEKYTSDKVHLWNHYSDMPRDNG